MFRLRRRGKRLATILNDVRRALPRAITDTFVEYGSERQRYFTQVVANWEGKPRFIVQVNRDGNVINLRVVAVGRHANKWYWVDRGTGQAAGNREDRYPIRPHGDYPLRFQVGYSPYTEAPARHNAGDGSRFGDWVSTYLVEHPGIEPREFTQKIRRDQLRTVIPDVARKFYVYMRG